MLHFCTSKTAWNFFGHLTLTTFSFVSLIFIFFFFFFVGQNWVTIRCTSAWQGVRELVCVRVQPPKNAQNTYIVHIPPLAGNWARKKIDFSAVFPFPGCSLRFMCAPFWSPASAFWALDPYAAHLLGVLVHRHKFCACVWARKVFVRGGNGGERQDTAPVRFSYCFDTFTRGDLQQHLQEWKGT